MENILNISGVLSLEDGVISVELDGLTYNLIDYLDAFDGKDVKISVVCSDRIA